MKADAGARRNRLRTVAQSAGGPHFVEDPLLREVDPGLLELSFRHVTLVVGGAGVLDGAREQHHREVERELVVVALEGREYAEPLRIAVEVEEVLIAAGKASFLRRHVRRLLE